MTFSLNFMHSYLAYSIKSSVKSLYEIVFCFSVGNSFHNKHYQCKIRHQGGSGSAGIFHCLDCRHM